MRAWRSRIILLVAIVLLPLEGVLLFSMWPYLSLVGQAIAGLFITCCVCGAVYAVALTRHHIALQVIMLRHADLRSRTIDAIRPLRKRTKMQAIPTGRNIACARCAIANGSARD